MALKDYYEEADVLDTLSWAGMADDARVRRLAHAYTEAEEKIRYRSRGYCGPTKGTVGTFIKSLYVPPRGTVASTIRDVLKEVQRIKTIRKKRAENRPATFRTEGEKSPRLRNSWIKQRRNTVSQRLFRIMKNGYHGLEATSHNCVGITSMGGCRVLVEAGGYYHSPRIYLRNMETGEEAVYLIKGRNIESVTGALARLAPKKILRKLFDGTSCTLSFEGGFNVDGEFVPFRNVEAVYRGDDIHNTPAKAPRS